MVLVGRGRVPLRGLHTPAALSFHYFYSLVTMIPSDLTLKAVLYEVTNYFLNIVQIYRPYILVNG